MSLNPQTDELINAMLPIVKRFHSNMQLAPHAATMSDAGEISGRAVVNENNESQMSVVEAISYFEAEFIKLAKSGEIAASAIFYHGTGIWPPTPAQSVEEANKIVVILEHIDGDSVYLLIPYVISNGECEYSMGSLVEKPSAIFSVESRSVNIKKGEKPWWKIW